MHRAPGTPGAGQASGPGGTGRRAGGGSPPDPPPRSPLWARRPQPRPPWHHVARACPQGGGQAPGRVGWWAGTRAAGLAPPADRLFQGEGLLGHCWQERRGSGEQVRTSTAARGKDGHPLSGGHCSSVFSRDQGWEGEGPVLGWAPSPGKGRLLPERLWRVTHAQVPGRPALALPSWEGAPRIVRTKFQQTSGSRPAANRLAVLLLSLRPLSFNLERLRFFFFRRNSQGLQCSWGFGRRRPRHRAPGPRFPRGPARAVRAAATRRRVVPGLGRPGLRAAPSGQARKVQERSPARDRPPLALLPSGKPRSETWRLRDPAFLPDGASGNFDRCREGQADFPPNRENFQQGRAWVVRHWRSGEQPGGGVPTSCPRKTLHAEQASLSAGRLQPPASRPRTLPSAELHGRGASHRTPLFQPRVTSLERSARRIVGRAAPVRLGEEGGVATRRPEVPVIVQGNASPSCPPLLVGAPGVVRDQVGEEGPVGVGEGRACVPGQPPACSLQGQSETQGGCWGPGTHKARLPQAGLGVICKQARPGGRALGLHGGGQGGRWGPSPPCRRHGCSTTGVCQGLLDGRT